MVWSSAQNEKQKGKRNKMWKQFVLVSVTKTSTVNPQPFAQQCWVDNREWARIRLSCFKQWNVWPTLCQTLRKFTKNNCNYFPPPYFIHGKEDYSTASGVFRFFLDSFCQFTISILMAICDMCFMTFTRYIFKRIDWSVALFQKSAQHKVAIDHFPIFRRPKIFRRAVITENKLKLPKGLKQIVDFH